MSNVWYLPLFFHLGIKTAKTLTFPSNSHRRRKFDCNVVVAMHARLHAICTLAFAVLITCDYCGTRERSEIAFPDSLSFAGA